MPLRRDDAGPIVPTGFVLASSDRRVTKTSHSSRTPKLLSVARGCFSAVDQQRSSIRRLLHAGFSGPAARAAGEDMQRSLVD